MASVAKELAIIISAENLTAPALAQLRAGLLGLQGATILSGTASLAAANEMRVLYGAQGQVLSRVLVGTAAISQMGAATATATARTSGLQKIMMGAAGAISPVTLGVAGLGIAAVLGTKAVVDAGMSWESAFAGVRKTVDATDAQLAGFASGIREMATEIPASREEIAKVAEAAGQLGIKNESLLSFTRTMIDMGVATNLSSDEAATALARLANITGMPQSNFDRLGSTVVDLGNKFAGTEAEIVEMGLRIAGAGAQIGLTEPQILAWGTALTSVGINAEAGGSAISRTFIDMAAAVAGGGKELRLFADVAGMDVQKFATLFRTDASGAVLAFIQGLGRMRTEGQNIFGVLESLGMSEIRQRDALLRLSGASDLVARATVVANEAWAENTALTAEAERRYDTTASKIEIVKNKWGDLAVGGFEASQPVLNAMIDLVGGLADVLGKVGDLAGGAGAAIGGVAGAAADAITPTGTYAEILATTNEELREMYRLEDLNLARQGKSRREELAGLQMPWVTGAAGKIGGKALYEDVVDTSRESADILDQYSANLAIAKAAERARREEIEGGLAAWALNKDAQEASTYTTELQTKQLKAQEKAEKDLAAETRRMASEATRAAAETKAAFDELARTPVAGTGAFAAQQAGLMDQIALSKFALDQMKRGELPRAGMGAEARRLAKLEGKLESSRLAEEAILGPTRRAQGLLGSSAPAELATGDLLRRLEVGRGTVGLPGMGGVTNQVAVSVDAAGNVSVTADSEMGRKVGDALARTLEELFGGGGALAQRNQGGANPQLAGAG